MTFAKRRTPFGKYDVTDAVRRAGSRPDARASAPRLGRPTRIDAAKVRAMKAKGVWATEIAKAVNIGRASVYRAFEGA